MEASERAWKLHVPPHALPRYLFHLAVPGLYSLSLIDELKKHVFLPSVSHSGDLLNEWGIMETLHLQLARQKCE